MKDAISESLLSLQNDGIQAIKSFETRLTTKEPAEMFFRTLKRNKFKSWKDTSKKVVAKTDGKAKELTFQNDILGILVAHSCQYKSGIDIDVVLQYPLNPVSVPLSTHDGAIRKTVKSKLFDATMSDLLIVPKENLPGQDTLYTYFLDVAAAIRSIVGKPDSIRELTARILQMVPCQYTKVFLACDTYKQNSIKAGEREA